ncbi:ProQ/FINO family protein [Halomonas sp. KM-1]|uniref:ProQ/FINO family protein n=1 Tax=Halomonas sp. KM-1 TaxID=590061 RepID=UPI000288549A|nr:ProQ/FINO family protein [Halomonas sp. KM-1]
MIEERSRQLFDVLETCADTALHELRSYRARIQELESRLAESEVRQQELEAARLELMEENRELDEQNRELEEDNARLRERLRKGEPTPAFPGPARRAQGLAALIGQRPRAEAAQQSEPAEAEQEAAGKTEAAGKAEAASKPLNPFAPAGGVSAAPTAPTYASFKVAPAQKALAERQGQLAIEQAPSADALLKQWYQRYPHTFFKGHTRPLKVGIHHDLAAREPWPEKLVRRALAGYVNLPRYLKAVREGAERIDLDGAPAGDVDAQAAEHAKRKLERLQSERLERSRPAGAAPKRGSGKANSGRSRAVATGAQPADKAARQSHENAPPKAASPASGAADPIAATADPEERMEAKLSALLAKHGSSRKGS